MTTSWFLKIALPTPLRRTFDYLPPENGLIEQLQIGQRILVPFGRSRLTGILLEKTTHSDIAKEKLKQVICALDEQSIIPDTLLPWFKRIADYYHHSLGEVLFTALPPDAKRDKSLLSYEIQWQVCNTDFETSQSLQRSPKQAALFECIKNRKGPVGLAELDSFKDPLRLLNELENKGVIARSERLNTQIKNKLTHRIGTTPVLTSAQRAALHEIKAHLQHFQCFLLKGITGSGKTEVYLQLIEQVIEQGKQALLLAPEIGLTPQLFLRVQQRFENHLGVMHSNMSAGDRKRLWQRILEGDVNILVGTRSAVFAPLPKLGLIVIDEEHDLSYKQQDGFRYSARDIALMRAQGENIPVILGSATPSLESLKNAENKRYTLIELPDRAGVAKAPKTHLIDMRNQDRHFAVSASLIEKIKHALQREEQALLFLNRRGFSPVLICQDCGHVNRCRACDYPQTYHQAERLLRCHQCTRAEAVPTQCAACGNHQLQPLGFGTERVMEQLSEAFPGTEILRIDRDTTRKRGAFEEILQQIEKPGPKILLGTQMIAKGHDFPNLTLVGVIDADQGLFGADFRSTERLAQLLVQVAGRAGRADKAGHVYIQTHQPEHPFFKTLFENGYQGFSRQALAERQQADFPPYSYSALFRAESAQAADARNLLEAVSNSLGGMTQHITAYDPIPAPLEKRANHYRFQWFICSADRTELHRFLHLALRTMEKHPLSRKVRWHLDVDPMDMS